MQTIKLNLIQLIRINNSNKDFVLYDLDNNNKITCLKFTDDLRRYRNKYQHFKLIDLIKNKSKNLKIEL
jgi:hypothetical protein